MITTMTTTMVDMITCSIASRWSPSERAKFGTINYEYLIFCHCLSVMFDSNPPLSHTTLQALRNLCEPSDQIIVRI